ncbi:hypothetical protein FRB95_006830 [Tulasnella sp. JGI-2019a]|nr:hypothetical protein FRB95_006830 [Tulasnella sp. JGI-2019a]
MDIPYNLTESVAVPEDTTTIDDASNPLPSASNVTAAVAEGAANEPLGNRSFDSREVSQMLNTIQANVSARLAVISNNIARLEERTNTAAHERLMLSQRLSQPRPTTRNTGDPVDRAYTRMMRAMERSAGENELRSSLEAMEMMYERSTAALEIAMADRALAAMGSESSPAVGGSASTGSMGPAHRAIRLGPSTSYADAAMSQPPSSAATQSYAAAASGDAADRSAMQRLWEHLAYRRQARMRATSPNDVDDGITSRGRRVMARESPQGENSPGSVSARNAVMNTPIWALRPRPRQMPLVTAGGASGIHASQAQIAITPPVASEPTPSAGSSDVLPTRTRQTTAAEYRRIANDIFLLGLENANDAVATGNIAAEDWALNELIRQTRRTRVSRDAARQAADDVPSPVVPSRTPEFEDESPQFWSTSPDHTYIHPPRLLRSTAEAHPVPDSSRTVEETLPSMPWTERRTTTDAMLAEAMNPRQGRSPNPGTQVIDRRSVQPPSMPVENNTAPRVIDLTRRALTAAQARLRHVPAPSRVRGGNEDTRHPDLTAISSDEDEPSPIRPHASQNHNAATTSRTRRRSWARIDHPGGDLVMTDAEDEEGLSQQEQRRQGSRLTSTSTTNLHDPHQYLSMLSQARPITSENAADTGGRQAQRTRLLYLPSPLSETPLLNPSNYPRASLRYARHFDEQNAFSSGSGAFKSVGQRNISGRPFVPYPLPMRLEDMAGV